MLEKEEPIVAKMYPTDMATTLQYAQGYGDIALRQYAREHIQVVLILTEINR